MKVFTVFTSAISLFSAITALQYTPTTELEADVSKRDLESITSSLLNGFDFADIISRINYERIAGWADDLLHEGNNLDYLDNILGALKRTELLPRAALYLITNNSTREIASDVLLRGMSIAGQVNTTSLFVALDRSDLAYSLISDTLRDDDFLPSILNVSRALIATGDLSFENILERAGSVLNRRSELEVDPDMSMHELVDLEKRDQVEDLLTTVFSSIEDSGLLNDTVHTLLTSEQFQDSAVIMIQGLLQNLGSNTTSSVNLSGMRPILSSLRASGILEHTLSRALEDEDLRDSLEDDLGHLLRRGTIRRTDLVSRQVAASYDFATATGSAADGATSAANHAVSTTSSDIRSSGTSGGSSDLSNTASQSSSTTATESTSSGSGSSSMNVPSGFISMVFAVLSLNLAL